MTSINVAKVLNGAPATDYRATAKFPVALQTPAYFSTRKLAGEKHAEPKGSTVERVRRIYDGVYDTAKGISLAQEDKLPWEYDTKGKLLSTELDELKFKIDYLKGLLCLDKKKEWTSSKSIFTAAFPELPDELRQGLINATAQQLIPLEMEYAQIKAESNFRQRLITWMLGEAPSKEYDKCWWVQVKVPPEYEDKTATEIFEENRDLANQVAKERKKLLDKIPGFTRGVIEHTDRLPMRSKEFLEELARNAPKTDEECFLWFKYIVLEEEPDFDYPFHEYYWNNLRRGPPTTQDVIDAYRKKDFEEYEKELQEEEKKKQKESEKELIPEGKEEESIISGPPVDSTSISELKEAEELPLKKKSKEEKRKEAQEKLEKAKAKAKEAKAKAKEEKAQRKAERAKKRGGENIEKESSELKESPLKKKFRFQPIKKEKGTEETASYSDKGPWTRLRANAYFQSTGDVPPHKKGNAFFVEAFNFLKTTRDMPLEEQHKLLRHLATGNYTEESNQGFVDMLKEQGVEVPEGKASDIVDWAVYNSHQRPENRVPIKETIRIIKEGKQEYENQKKREIEAAEERNKTPEQRAAEKAKRKAERIKLSEEKAAHQKKIFELTQDPVLAGRVKEYLDTEHTLLDQLKLPKALAVAKKSGDTEKIRELKIKRDKVLQADIAVAIAKNYIINSRTHKLIETNNFKQAIQTLINKNSSTENTDLLKATEAIQMAKDLANDWNQAQRPGTFEKFVQENLADWLQIHKP